MNQARSNRKICAGFSTFCLDFILVNTVQKTFGKSKLFLLKKLCSLANFLPKTQGHATANEVTVGANSMALPNSQQSECKVGQASFWLLQSEWKMARWLARWIMWLKPNLWRLLLRPLYVMFEDIKKTNCTFWTVNFWFISNSYIFLSSCGTKLNFI